MKAQAPPKVSVVIPCRNEVEYIRQVIGSVLEAEVPEGGMEVIVVDGMSDDGTREALAEICARSPSVRVIDNPKKAVPSAMNLGIRESRGEILVRLDAHTYYEPSYIAECVRWLEKSGADNVGGALLAEPTADTWVGRALAMTVRHPFGSGNAHHKASVVREPRYVDTVPFGCFRRELFDRVGLYREDLARSQDMEFNNRIRKAGGKILLVPSIRSRYQVRSTLRRVVPYYWSNGFWVVFPLKFGAAAFRPRHLVPAAFVASLLGFGLAGLFWAWARWALAAVLGSYLLASLAAAVHCALRERRIEYLFTLPPAFALLHGVHGLASLYAFGCLALEKVLPEGAFEKETPTHRV